MTRVGSLAVTHREEVQVSILHGCDWTIAEAIDDLMLTVRELRRLHEQGFTRLDVLDCPLFPKSELIFTSHKEGEQ